MRGLLDIDSYYCELGQVGWWHEAWTSTRTCTEPAIERSLRSHISFLVVGTYDILFPGSSASMLSMYPSGIVRLRLAVTTSLSTNLPTIKDTVTYDDEIINPILSPLRDDHLGRSSTSCGCSEGCS